MHELLWAGATVLLQACGESGGFVMRRIQKRNEIRLGSLEANLREIHGALGGPWAVAPRVQQMRTFGETQHVDLVIGHNKHERRLEAIEKAHAPHCPKCKQQLPEVL